MTEIGKDAPEDVSIAAGIYPTEAPAHPATEKREFSAWHKPRKQWVRKYQWLNEIGTLVKKLEFRDNRPLRYLSLPGDDLLDVRVIHELCAKEKRQLRYLGFSTKDPKKEGTQLSISINEVSNLEFISKESRVVNSLFEMVANENTKASAYMKEAGPFDVINIDLCDSFASKKHGPERKEPTYYEGIQKILEFQLHNTTQPWILFLTTKTSPEDVFEEDARKLWGAIQSNMTANPDFKARLEKFLDHKLDAINRAPGQVLQLEKLKFLKFFGVGICKWILRNMFSAEPSCAVVAGSIAYYRIAGGTEPEMLSISLHFEPIHKALEDRANLVRPQTVVPAPQPPNEPTLAMMVIDQYEKATDVDQTLAGNATLFENMLKQSAELLESARYDCTDYRAWATKVEVVTT